MSGAVKVQGKWIRCTVEIRCLKIDYNGNVITISYILNHLEVNE